MVSSNTTSSNHDEQQHHGTRRVGFNDLSTINSEASIDEGPSPHWDTETGAFFFFFLVIKMKKRMEIRYDHSTS